jgi:glycerophosphoryl diester phosphodiesterase
VGVWANLRHPAYFAGIDLALEARAAEVVRSNGYDSSAAAMFVGASEAEALKSLATLTRARLVQRLQGAEAMPPSLAEFRAYVSGVCVNANRLLSAPGAPPEISPDFPLGDAHAAGLAVYAKAEDPSADSGNRRWLRDLFVAGCDGIACRTPAQAAKARIDAASELRRHPRSLDKA